MARYDAEKLETTTRRIFVKAGSAEPEAAMIAKLLVEANLTGHDSHGVGLIPRYISNINDGTMLLNASLSVALDTGGMIICDGGLGAGQSMGHAAMTLAIARAQQNGSCIISLRNSHHLGRIGHWAELCAAAGLVSIHFVNVRATPAVAMFGGGQARLGTNPFAAGFPRSGADPIIIDFATSQLAVGKIRVALNQGVPVAEGTLLDAEGRPTTDPSVLFEPPLGSLLPFGGHKGGALALACELLAAAMVGAPVQDGPANSTAIVNSMFSVLVDPAMLGTAEDYARQLDSVTRWVLSENETGGAVKLPGDPERAARADRRANGIEIDAVTIAQITEVATKLGLEGTLFQTMER